MRAGTGEGARRRKMWGVSLQAPAMSWTDLPCPAQYRLPCPALGPPSTHTAPSGRGAWPGQKRGGAPRTSRACHRGGSVALLFSIRPRQAGPRTKLTHRPCLWRACLGSMGLPLRVCRREPKTPGCRASTHLPRHHPPAMPAPTCMQCQHPPATDKVQVQRAPGHPCRDGQRLAQRRPLCPLRPLQRQGARQEALGMQEGGGSGWASVLARFRGMLDSPAIVSAAPTLPRPASPNSRLNRAQASSCGSSCTFRCSVKLCGAHGGRRRN